MNRLSLLLLACSSDYAVHVPISRDCGRVAIAEYQAGSEDCVRLEDMNGNSLFKLSTSESCGGPPCATAQPGETLLVLERVKFGERAEWSVQVGACDLLPACCGDYEPCGGFCCW